MVLRRVRLGSSVAWKLARELKARDCQIDGTERLEVASYSCHCGWEQQKVGAGVKSITYVPKACVSGNDLTEACK